MGVGGCELQIKVGHTREGGGGSDVNRADHTRCTRKLILMKICPGTDSLPVSD